MQRLRTFLATGRGWFALLVACTLAVRLVVPSGFMPGVENGRIVLQLCSGTVSSASVAMPGMHHGKSDGGEHGKTEMPCAFGGLGTASLGSADPVLLVAAVLFAFLLAARAVPQLLPASPGRLRPPLRAPPVA